MGDGTPVLHDSLDPEGGSKRSMRLQSGRVGKIWRLVCGTNTDSLEQIDQSVIEHRCAKSTSLKPFYSNRTKPGGMPEAK